VNVCQTVVVDYGIGNVRSVCRAVESCGGRPILSSEAKEIARAERLVVPGVGAFSDCVDALRNQRLVDPIYKFITTGRPFLGICVGMQMLFEHSEEFDGADGLGIIRGSVQQIATQSDGVKKRKIPHIGWGGVVPEHQNGWTNTPLDTTSPGTYFYFVHSFVAQPADPECLIAVTDHQGLKITAAVQKENVFGVQFHPEKSGLAGINFWSRFICQ
jgi:imidazole glycerol-phosphate synthase subunit HisH